MNHAQIARAVMLSVYTLMVTAFAFHVVTGHLVTINQSQPQLPRAK